MYNRQKVLQSKVPTYDITNLKCVTGQVLMEFLKIVTFEKFVEKILKKRQCDRQQGAKGKIYQYLGVLDKSSKWVKNDCKGLDKIQSEAWNSERGCCCWGEKRLRFIIYSDPNNTISTCRQSVWIIIHCNNLNASFIYTT